MSEAIPHARSNSGISFLLAALMAPPMVGGLAGVVVLVVIAIGSGSFDGFDRLLGTALLYGAILGAMFGWPVALLLGFIAHKVMQKRNWTGAGHYMLAAAGGGAILTLLILVLAAGMGGGVNAWLIYVPVLLLAAALSGLVFWLIRRPDRDLKITEVS